MNPYEILELSPGASAEEIKSAYHRLAKQWHPDKFVGPAKAEAESKFRHLAEAFSMLKDVARGAASPTPVQASVNPSESRIDLEEAPAPKERNAEDWYREAKACMDHGDFQKALGLVHFAIKMDGGKGEYQALLARAVAESTGDKKAESRALEAAIRLNPRDVDSTIRLAELFQSVGMYARATALWETARRIAPNHPVFAKAVPAKSKGYLGGSLADQWAELVGRIRGGMARMKGGR
ncbi:J domain-containing protein [Holophaga foetida]|uniref:J domain-containing protein n=1 Tax=Holophaga foetida TaxID=35839 RepID=UPI000247507A|nr:J domain-containing protein [Holophaga foetida]